MQRSLLVIESLVFVLFSAGCDSSGGAGAPVSNSTVAEGKPDGDLTQVSVALTTVPSGVLCVKLDLSGVIVKSATFAVASGGSSANLDLGVVPPGSLSVVPSAYNVACASVTSATTPSWIGQRVTANVVAGIPATIAVTLVQNAPASAQVDFAPTVKAISAGYYSSTALLYDGTVKSWGQYTGDGSSVSRNRPVNVVTSSGALTGVAFLGSGSLANHQCVAKTTGYAWCWGYNGSGQLGNGTSTNSLVAVQVNTAYQFTQIVGGGYHTFGVIGQGGGLCWGNNQYGQFGDESTNSSLVPTPCAGSLVQASAGYYSTCGLTSRLRLQVSCAGRNDTGQLGTGDTNNVNYYAASTSLQSPVFAPQGVAMGSQHTCALLQDGTARCVGNNGAGQLGDGSTANSLLGVVVQGMERAVGIYAGAASTYVVKDDRTVWAWGANSLGQLGDGTIANRTTPVQVAGLTDVVGMAAGSSHACALKPDGTVWCWGLNTSGQLGDGTVMSRTTPVKVLF